MLTRKCLMLAIVSASLITAPTLLADDDHGGGSGNSGSGSGGSGGGSGGGGSGGSGSGSGGGGGNSNGGGGGNTASTASTSSMVRSAQRALKDAGDAVERTMKNEKDARVRTIFQMRASGASPAEISAYLAESTAVMSAHAAAGTQQIEALKASLIASLPVNATAGQRNAVQSAANSAITKVNKRKRSTVQDMTRAVTGRLPAGMNFEHPFPEHGPGHT